MDCTDYKLVCTRKRRPAWAVNAKKLMVRCIGKQQLRRFEIAEMYWLKNMTASDIASALNMNKPAVEMVISRLANE